MEIGALHKPVKIRDSATVKYVDYKTLEENRKRSPELAGEEIVQTDVVDDGFVLEKIPNSSVDFIVANHALEHSPDPYGTLLTWKDKIAVGGILFVAVPIADRCYDRGRPITTLKHLLEDHLSHLFSLFLLHLPVAFLPPGRHASRGHAKKP